jgi:hypothetical protein
MVWGGVLVKCVRLTSTVRRDAKNEELHVLVTPHFKRYVHSTSWAPYFPLHVVHTHHFVCVSRFTFCASYTPLRELLISDLKWFYTPLHGRLTFHLIFFLHSTSYASHAHFVSFLYSTSHDSYTPLHTLLTFHFTCFTTESNQQFSLLAVIFLQLIVIIRTRHVTAESVSFKTVPSSRTAG